MNNVPNPHDLSVGVGRRDTVRDVLKCRMRRRLGGLPLREVPAVRMTVDHFQLISSMFEIQQTLLRPNFSQLLQASKSQTDNSMYH